MQINSRKPDQSLSEEECKSLATAMNKKYSPFTRDRFFEFQSKNEAGIVEVTATLRNQDGSFFYPVEGRVNSRDQNVKAGDPTGVLIDTIDQYYQEYLLNDGDVYLPIDWADYESDGIKMQLRGQIRNLVLEKMADDILN
jgi:hypothetical protein